jgi:two-component system copper resistance phosphate regulon response regulator CusR
LQKTKAMYILVVEDEPKVASFIKKGLEDYGHEVTIAEDGDKGLELALGSQWDIVLLDVMLPGLQGMEVCKKIRESGSMVPVMMLTALGTIEDKMEGFDLGADDYLVKPFEFKELLARINSLHRRNSKSDDQSAILYLADLQLNTNKHEVLREGKLINLTAKEYAILEYLLKHKERIVSRTELTENIWGQGFDTGTNVVDVYINLLRKKVDKNFSQKLIYTRVGFGYIITEKHHENQE